MRYVLGQFLRASLKGFELWVRAACGSKMSPFSHVIKKFDSVLISLWFLNLCLHLGNLPAFET
jgi:hypothetical protein